MFVKQIKYLISLASIKHDFGKSRNLIVHHGLMGSSKNFRSICKNPAISKYSNVHLIDARNHGQSQHTQTHYIADLADDLYDYIIEHKLDDPKKPLTLVGHSMGGIALMEFTKRYNDQQIQNFIDRVILIDISCKPIMRKASYKQTGKMLRDMNQINLNQTTQEVFSTIDRFAITPQISGLIKSSIVVLGQNSHKWKVNLEVLVQYYPDIGNYSLVDSQMKSLKWKKPIQLIYGSKSNYVDEQQIREFKFGYPQMGDQHFYRVTDAGHWVHFDKTKQFLVLMDYLLKKDERVQI